jgi:hypothetical protein
MLVPGERIPSASNTDMSSFRTSTYNVNGAFSLEFRSLESLYASLTTRCGAALLIGNQIATPVELALSISALIFLRDLWSAHWRSPSENDVRKLEAQHNASTKSNVAPNVVSLLLGELGGLGTSINADGFPTLGFTNVTLLPSEFKESMLSYILDLSDPCDSPETDALTLCSLSCPSPIRGPGSS